MIRSRNCDKSLFAVNHPFDAHLSTHAASLTNSQLFRSTALRGDPGGCDVRGPCLNLVPGYRVASPDTSSLFTQQPAGTMAAASVSPLDQHGEGDPQLVVFLFDRRLEQSTCEEKCLAVRGGFAELRHDVCEVMRGAVC